MFNFVEYAYAEEAETVTTAETEHASDEGLAGSLGSVYPNPAALWPTWLAFIILFVVLYKLAFPAIIGMLDKRSAAIQESLEKAEQTKVEAERLLEEYKEQMAEARSDAGRVIDQGRKVAESMKEEIVAKANEEAAAIVAKARETMEAERRSAVAELQAAVADVSVSVAGKLIGEKLSTADHAALIEKYLAEVGGLNDN